MRPKRAVLFVLGSSLALAASLAPGCSRQDPKQDSGQVFGQLTALADKYETDKGSLGHNYTEVYEYFFLPKKHEARKIFEIGVLEGASLRTLRDFFPNATIYGIDIEDTSQLNSKRLKTFVADQSSREQLKKFIGEYGSDFDIIIDDGGHTMEQQQVSFGYLFNHVRPGGYYIIEDVHTSRYGRKYGVEEGAKNSTLTMIHTYMDEAQIISQYMTAEEGRYLNDNIKYAQLHIGQGGASLACLFKKK
jgi:hypothetical protein